MKEFKYILFTAGRGPKECSLVVQGVQQQFKKYLILNNVEYDIVKQKNGLIKRSIETIVFKVFTNDVSIIKPWIGTIQWVCKSPLRKYNKRKNWFIKCVEVVFANQFEVDTKDVLVQTFRASGPGGQHRNKVETAVRLIHNASGIIVTATDSKSQMQNRKKAWQKIETQLKIRNEQLLKSNNTEQWATQITIERGAAVKTFVGLNFKELNKA